MFLAFTYDGFETRLNQNVTAGSAPSMSLLYNMGTNRIANTGYNHDANGDVIAAPGNVTSYDVENRLASSNTGASYSYALDNKRILESGATLNLVFYNGALNVYFGRKLVQSAGKLVITDRLGSVRANLTTGERFNYFPYGEENGTTGNGSNYFVNESCFNLIESFVAGNLGVKGALTDPFTSQGVTVSFNLGNSNPNCATMTGFGNVGAGAPTFFFGYANTTTTPPPSGGRRGGPRTPGPRLPRNPRQARYCNMGFGANVSIAVWLLASVLPMAGQDSQTRSATALQLLSDYTERVRWQHCWLPATVSTSYAPGTEVQVHVLFARTAAGFCAAALEICQIYERDANGRFEFLTEWGSEPNQSEASLPTRFAEEYAKAKGLRPILGTGPGQHQKDERAFDVTKMVAPLPSQQPSEAFDSAPSFTWKLRPLTPPKPVSARTRSSDASILRREVLTVVKSFRKGCGAAGQAVIPFHSSHDPRMFVYVDLGGHCEKGIFEFLKRAEGGWSFSRFVVDEVDVQLLLPRIQKARMETLRLTG